MKLSPMLRYAGAIAALLLLSVGDVEGKKKVVSASKAAKARAAFMKAMEPSHKRLGGDAERKQNMYRKLFSKAKPLVRKLDQDEQWEQFGFDITQYSIKYNGCSSVMTYSDELAEQEDVDTVFANKRFVIFRLCPTQYCNKYSVTGCSYDYGEYLVLLEDYLESFAQYTNEKLEDFCDYCRPCIEADEEAAAADDDGNGGRRLNDAQEEEEGEQCDEEICEDYSMCVEEEPADDDAAEEEEEVNMEEFFDCVRVEYGDDDGNDEEYFLGPHCGSDGYTVSIGVYSDEECNTYIGDDMSVEDVAGFSIDTDELSSYFPKECVSCLEYVSDMVS